ncbi:hypothetical protein Esi_0073_0058 [Ectocarpus siliculosus]|uniref:Uncharacterized protein n=1 Tax=Ectocarpus siliculosus TaxID=2880 RepID=D7G6A1_ECTSI|nr:hypothetical protein Esi_0073_0058 [Ectocarpus siliculosus]|eukprot:CBJ27496.1 hypothetical protein Esi_0073_0058 [Ectocarpus siliculosus]
MIPTRFSQRARNLEYATKRAGYAPSLAFRAMSRKDMAVHSMLNVKEAVAAGALVRMKTGKRRGAESLPPAVPERGRRGQEAIPYGGVGGGGGRVEPEALPPRRRLHDARGPGGTGVILGRRRQQQ